MTDSCAPNAETQWTLPLARWAVWEAHADDKGAPASPDVSFVEPMLRRRLSSLAKMSLKVAHDCAHDIPDVRFVFASRHGDLARTTTMLNDLAAHEPVSPTAFSMSVLNASAGLFSILQGNRAPSTAISATACSLGYGLLEASLQLATHPEQSVLLVYADEPVPDVYGEPALSQVKAHAIGLLLQSGSSLHINCTMSATPGVQSSEPQSLAFLRALAQGHADWHSGSSLWSWHKSGS
jgi:Beta-ketoacyl synthase, N-terminal domain